MGYITQCEQEQLHRSGAIQPHGVLLVVDNDQRLTHYSSNAEEVLQPASRLAPGDALPAELMPLIHNDSAASHTHRYSQFINSQGQHFYVTVVQQEKYRLLELLPVPYAHTLAPLEFQLPILFHNTQERDEVRQRLLHWIHQVTGHQRIMYYQFMHNGDGQVLQEVCKDPGLGSYLDLRFPASDIPMIARQLYIQNPWREIPAASATSLSVIGHSTPDLSLSDLRSVSPIHQQYMANMGIEASVSFPVLNNTRLDALISCHSQHRHKLPQPTLEQIAQTVRTFSLLQQDMEARQRLSLIDEFAQDTHLIRHLLESGEPITRIWHEFSDQLAHYFQADGIILCGDQWVLSSGDTLGQSAFAAVDAWFLNHNDSRVVHTDHLSTLIDSLPLTEVAGLCGIQFRPQTPHLAPSYRLYLCRNEHIHNVTWGGNPNKPLENLTAGEPISPRLSFSKWVEKRMGYSRLWPNEIELQLHQLRLLLESCPMTLDTHL